MRYHIKFPAPEPKPYVTWGDNERVKVSTILGVERGSEGARSIKIRTTDHTVIWGFQSSQEAVSAYKALTDRVAEVDDTEDLSEGH